LRRGGGGGGRVEIDGQVRETNNINLTPFGEEQEEVA